MTCISLASGVPSAAIQIDSVPSNSLTYLRCCSGSLATGIEKLSWRAGLPFQVSAFSPLNGSSSTLRDKVDAADAIGAISCVSSLSSAQTVGVFAFGSCANWRCSASMRASVSRA